MKGKRTLRRTLRRAQQLANLTGQPQRVFRDNGNETYRIGPYFPRGSKASVPRDRDNTHKPAGMVRAIYHRGKLPQCSKSQSMPYYGGTYYGITVWPK